MKKFLITVFIFSIPIILYILPPTYVLFTTGESFCDIHDVLKSPDKKFLMGYSYEESNYKYSKWWSLQHHAPYSVACLGSSRVLEFRKEMFDVPFYNAGLAAMTLTDFKPFLQSIDSTRYPSYLIINLDLWMFNAAWDDLTHLPPADKWSKSASTRPTPQRYKDVWTDLLNQKYTLTTFSSKQSPVQKIGINAQLYNMGLRNDGSMSYGTQIDKLMAGDSTANDYQYNKTFTWIEQGNKRFEHADTINPEAIVVLEEFLSFCKAHSIEVIAFFPPYAEKVYSKMQETGKYGYLTKVKPAVEPLFKKYDFELYDYTLIDKCHSHDAETIDGFHGGEVTYLRLLIDMIASGSRLNKVTDAHRLKKDLQNRVNNYTVYSY